MPTQSGSTWTTSCTSAPGLKSADEDCWTRSECIAGLVCVGAVQGHAGTCVAFCCPSNNEPCNGGLCNNLAEWGPNATTYTCSYGKQCELLTANACPSGDQCHLQPAAGMGVAICFTPSPTPEPELGPCQYLNDCGDMQQCHMGVSGGTCLWYCALTGSKTSQPPGLGGCPKGEMCASGDQGGPFNLGVANVGLCIPNGGQPDAGPDASDGGGGNDDAGSDASDAATNDAGDAGDAGDEDADIQDADIQDADIQDADIQDAGTQDASADG
jgi:hypothetical protein